MFGLSTVKLIAYGIAAAALIGLLILVNSWRIDSNKLESAQQKLKQVRADYAERDRLRTEQDKISTDKARDYETQLADARKTNTELAGRRPAVRLCRSAPSVPAVPKPSAEPATAPREGLHSETGPSANQGPDISRDLYRLALEADECSVRLTTLQGWLVEQLAVQ